MNHSFEIPIYFSFLDSNLKEMFETLSSTGLLNEQNNDRYQLVVSSSDATLLPTITINNYHAWLHSIPNVNSDSDTLPTIGIVANYDTFGGSPTLSNGVDQNGSGTIGLLELTRIFSRLYSDERTHGHYNLLFILTGAGRMNYAGTKHWLKSIDTRILESLEFVLCLNAIGNGQNLYLHVSKNAKTDEIKQLHQVTKNEDNYIIF
jgi:hypothetical protein